MQIYISGAFWQDFPRPTVWNKNFWGAKIFMPQYFLLWAIDCPPRPQDRLLCCIITKVAAVTMQCIYWASAAKCSVNPRAYQQCGASMLVRYECHYCAPGIHSCHRYGTVCSRVGNSINNVCHVLCGWVPYLAPLYNSHLGATSGYPAVNDA